MMMQMPLMVKLLDDEDTGSPEKIFPVHKIHLIQKVYVVFRQDR